jgi:hypothetical protein
MPTFIVGTVDKPNRNNRIYTKECMEKAIDDVRKQIKEQRLLGELNPDYDCAQTILVNVSHVVKDLRIEGCDVVADIDILTTRRGLKLQELLKSHNVEFVTRGEGNVNKDGTITDFSLISVDAVLAPPDRTI